MKNARQIKILELIEKETIETQEELARRLAQEGFVVTQATVSRDIRALKLTKTPAGGGRQKYAAVASSAAVPEEKFARILRDGFVSMDTAQNILVVRTVSGMAMAVAAALDAMHFPEMVGCIAGDDTILCAVRSTAETRTLTDRIEHLL